MAKITFFLGLAGSGKSHLAEMLEKETGAAMFEGPAGNKEVKLRMLQHLAGGGSCIVEEIAYCLPSQREAIVLEICSKIPEIEIEWICLENDLESANWNVKHRNIEGKENVLGHLRINQCYHGLYIYPGGVKAIPIYRVNESKTSA